MWDETKHAGFWLENPKERGHLGDMDVDVEDSIKMDFTEIGWESLDWIRVAWNRESSRVLWTRWSAFWVRFNSRKVLC